MARTESGCITGLFRLLQLLRQEQPLTVLLECVRMHINLRKVRLRNIAKAQARLPELLLQTNKHNVSALYQATAEACVAVKYVPKVWQPTSFLTFLKGLKFLLALCLGGSKRMEGSLSGCGAPILSSQCAGCCCRRATECAALLLVTRWLQVASWWRSVLGRRQEQLGLWVKSGSVDMADMALLETPAC